MNPDSKNSSWVNGTLFLVELIVMATWKNGDTAKNA
jgi:hypothetical protein